MPSLPMLNAARRVPLMIAAVVVAASLLALAPSSASASAEGCTKWGKIGAVTIPYIDVRVTIPKGAMCTEVDGDGLRIEKHEADFLAAGQVCFWQFTFYYVDRNGKVYDKRKGPYHKFCSPAGYDFVDFVGALDARPGKACVKLIASRKLLAIHCHNIYPRPRWKFWG